MANAEVDKIILEIKELNVNEQLLVRDMLDTIIQPKDEARGRAELRRALRTDGSVTHTRVPRSADVPERRLIQVQGKPVSETIIEERR